MPRPGEGAVCLDRLDEQEDQSLTFTAGYGAAGWASRGSGDGSRIGGRVGFHRKTLASFLQAFGDAGLVLGSVRGSSHPAPSCPGTWHCSPKSRV